MINSRLAVVAEKEWRDGWRNRWLLAITLVFAIMSVGISWFGSAAFGQTGPAPLATTIASLSSLAVLVMPLIALLLGYDAFVGEQEQGTLLLLMAYPISRAALVLGKFVGQGAILGVATLVGFGSAALLLGIDSGDWSHLPAFGVFVAAAILLGLVFLAMGHLLSLLVSEKSRAAGIALFLWFFFALLYDLGLLAVLVGTEGWLDSSLLKALLIANPTDAFRLINIAQLETSGQGVLASIGQIETPVYQLFLWLGIWIAAIQGLAVLRFRAQ